MDDDEHVLVVGQLDVARRKPRLEREKLLDVDVIPVRSRFPGHWAPRCHAAALATSCPNFEPPLLSELRMAIDENPFLLPLRRPPSGRRSCASSSFCRRQRTSAPSRSPPAVRRRSQPRPARTRPKRCASCKARSPTARVSPGCASAGTRRSRFRAPSRPRAEPADRSSASAAACLLAFAGRARENVRPA